MHLFALVLLAACGDDPSTTAQPAGHPPTAAAPAAAAPGEQLAFTEPVLPDDPLTLRAPVGPTDPTWRGAPTTLRWQPLLRTGERGFGTLFDLQGKPIEGVCDHQDNNTMLRNEHGLFLVSHFECTPGGIYVTPLNEDALSGSITVAGDPVPVDARALEGIWLPCAGMVSPWGTHIGSEEYDPDARWIQPDGSMPAEHDEYGSWRRMMRAFTDPKLANPYRYGFTPELSVIDPTGRATVTRHYAPGRLSHEQAYVLADQRTTLLSDDGHAGGMYLFIADKPGALDAGTLYAAKLGAPDAGRWPISWVSLGHADDATIGALIDARPRFDELFRVADPVDGACPADLTHVKTMLGDECLALAPASARIPDPALAASRLETRRYAAMLGASTEFEKGEGITFDADSGTFYVAYAQVSGRMVAEPGSPLDQLAMEPNPCGIIGSYNTGKANDSAGAPIDSAQVPLSFGAALSGKPIEPADRGHRCDTTKLAGPDNLLWLPGYQLLAVAEDTSARPNNALWLFDLPTGKGRRLLLAPPGAEVTGLSWTRLASQGYITISAQHPWEELPKQLSIPADFDDSEHRSWTGVLGPFPLPTAAR